MTTTPPTQFHLFPSLPYEIRHKIYKHILSEPRTVKITGEKGIMTSTSRARRYLKRYNSSTPIPTLLHLSHETRLLALKHYKPHFRTQCSPSYTYINFETDTIELADGILSYLEGREETDKISKLCVQVMDAAYFSHYHLEMLVHMKRLLQADIRVKEEDVHGWQPAGHFLRALWGDLRELRRQNQEWEYPRIRLMYWDGDEGVERLFAVVEGAWRGDDEEQEDI